MTSIDEVRHDAYNKAIDDFIKSIRDIVFDYYTNGAYVNYDDLLMKVEQLKAGGENDKSI